MTFKNSWYKYGKQKESQILPILNEFFGSEIKAYDERYTNHDFYDNNYEYELKSRTVKKTQFKDTLIAVNKICGDKPIRLIFNYTDCLCYILYDKERFDTYRKDYVRGEDKLHFMIPIEDLETIKVWEK